MEIGDTLQTVTGETVTFQGFDPDSQSLVNGKWVPGILIREADGTISSADPRQIIPPDPVH